MAPAIFKPQPFKGIDLDFPYTAWTLGEESQGIPPEFVDGVRGFLIAHSLVPTTKCGGIPKFKFKYTVGLGFESDAVTKETAKVVVFLNPIP